MIFFVYSAGWFRVNNRTSSRWYAVPDSRRQGFTDGGRHTTHARNQNTTRSTTVTFTTLLMHTTTSVMYL